jgi:hypothetical protein
MGERKWLTYLHEEVGRRYCGKGYLEILNDLDASSFIDTDGSDSSRIWHRVTELVYSDGLKKYISAVIAWEYSMSGVLATVEEGGRSF